MTPPTPARISTEIELTREQVVVEDLLQLRDKLEVLARELGPDDKMTNRIMKHVTDVEEMIRRYQRRRRGGR